MSIHNSCHGVRELHLSSPSEMNIPYFSKLRDLLKLVEGIEVLEPKRIDECCGFGGMFAVEEPEVSVCMGHDKVKDHMSTGAEFITGADSSCLMHMQGVIEREHLPIQTKCSSRTPWQLLCILTLWGKTAGSFSGFTIS